MKQYTTKVLKSLALSFIVFPLLYILLAATLFDIPLNNCVGIILSPFYYIVSVAMVVAGYGVWEVRRWSWYVFLAAQFLVCYENANLLLNYSASHQKVMAFVLSSLIQVILVRRVSSEIRVPYLYPRIRWWESNPYYQLSVPVKLKRTNGEVLEGSILDLSMAGCFVKLRPDLVQDEVLFLEFSLFNYAVTCSGAAVWCTQSAVTHPKGVGIKFNLLLRAQKRSLRFISRRLKKMASLYRRSRYLMSAEEYEKKMQEIATKGRPVSK